MPLCGGRTSGLASGLLASFLLASTSLAQSPTRVSPTTRGVFANGARIAWLGDSITQAALYTQFVETFAWSRYPRRRIAFFNCGTGGDRAADALARLTQDVIPHKPTHVFVCLGMNDGGFVRFDAKLYALFRRDYASLLDRLAKRGLAATLIAPPPCDAVHPRRMLAQGVDTLELSRDYELVLARYSDWLRTEAKRRSLGFVDAFGRMSRDVERLRVANPAATLVPDRVHPGAVGSALMSLEVLRSLGQVAARCRISLRTGSKPKGTSPGGGKDLGRERRSPSLIAAEGCSVDKLRWRASSLEFAVQGHNLPWVLPVAARGVASLAPDYCESNACIVRIEGLPNADWTLRVDGVRLVTRTAKQWARGVDVGLLREHPDWRQGERLAIANQKRNGLIRIVVRDVWRMRSALARLQRNGGISQEIASVREAIAKAEALAERARARITKLEAEIEGLRRPKPRVWRLEPRYAPFDVELGPRAKPGK